MANRSYLPTSHHLLTTGFSPLTSLRGPALSASSNRGSSPPPEFAYDVVYPREQSSRTSSTSSREAGLGSYNVSRAAPTSPGNSALGMAYSSVQDFPYGLSGVQMPTYNFGSELYNYVSNGFPRKSRMCTFCNKVFTRSTTRRYHERRCPLLRASNSLAKNEENSQASTLSALKEQQSQQQQQRQKESPGNSTNSNSSSGGRSTNNHHHHHSSSLPRTLSNSMTNTTTAQSTGSIPQASPPLPSLHPAYPTQFPKSAATLVSSPSRSSAYSYPHPYNSHFYNSLSAAALASLEQNSGGKHQHHHRHQTHQESEGGGSHPWKASSVSPPTPTGKLSEQTNPFGAKLGSALSGSGPLSKTLTPEAVVDLTARYCADFSLRTRPPIFPAPSLRAPHSPPSPEPGETHNKYLGHGHSRYDDELVRDGSGRSREVGDRDSDRRSSRESRESPVEGMTSLHPSLHTSKLLWQISGGADRDKVSSTGYSPAAAMPSSTSSSTRDAREFRRQSSSPMSDTAWEKEPREPFMKVDPLDEDDEDEFDDEEDEDEVEEDEEQFKSDSNNMDGGDTVVGERCRDKEEDPSRVRPGSGNKNASYANLVCQFCEKLFPDEVTKRAHEALHSQKKCFSCCVCPASFHCGYSLRVHMMRNHKEGPYKCKNCFLDYETASDFRTHLVKEHSLPQTEYQSLRVFRGLTHSGSASSPSPDSVLDTNAVSEGGEEDDSAVAGAPSAFKHLRRSVDHTDEHYKFSEGATKASLLSSKSISSTSTTAVPTTNANVETEEETEICKICNKSFSKSYIRLHERAHADQKPYECPICNKRFGYKNNMKSHMKLHQGLKPYQCQICGARFTRGSTLRRHGRRHNVSNSAMLDYVLYNQRASGRGGGGGAAGSAAAAAASLAHHKASMVPNSLLGAKSHYLLPNSHAITSSNNNNSAVTTTNSTSMPPIQLAPPHHHLDHQSGLLSSHQSAAITSKHSAFGSMPSLIPAAAGATLGNMSLDSERFGIGHANSGNNSVKQRSPNHLLSPTGTSPGGSTGHPNPFTTPNPMVGGLAAVAAANLFGYPNAASNPHLYQFYASAAVGNPLMGYAPYAATQASHSVQSDALNLSLNKRKSPCSKEEPLDNAGIIDNNEDAGRYKDGPPNPKHRKLSDDEPNPHPKTSSPTDDINFVDSSSGVSSASPDSKSMVKQEMDEEPAGDETKSECDKRMKSLSSPLSSSASLSPPPPGELSSRKNVTLSPGRNLKLDCGDDVTDDLKQRHPHRHERGNDDNRHHSHLQLYDPHHHHEHNEDHKLTLRVSTEDFGAQVNICCPSPHVQSSTGSVPEQLSPIPTTNNNESNNACSDNTFSPVGSSSGSVTQTLHSRPATSPTGSGNASQASSPVNSNTAPSPTAHNDDENDDLLLSLLNSGRLFRCSFCDIYFTEYAMFRLHQKYHESDVDRPFLCAVCREDCKDKTYFTVHLSEHLGIAPKHGLP